MTKVVRHAGLQVLFFGMSACTAQPTAVNLEFYASQEVAQVQLVDQSNAQNSETLMLEGSTGSACKKEQRGSFVIRFPDETERTSLDLRVIALGADGKALQGENYSVTEDIPISRGSTFSQSIYFCPDRPMDDAGMDDIGPTDAERIDGGILDAAEPQIDSSLMDAGPTDAGPTDAGPTDAGPTDAGPTDAGPTDAGPTDAGPTDADPSDAAVDAGPPPVCGDGVVDASVENCDDGNRQNNDGCSSMCLLENGYTCVQGLRGPSVCKQNVTPISIGHDLYQALDNSNNMNVYLGAGTHYISDTITIDDSNRVVSIVGTGPGVTIRGGDSSSRDNIEIFVLDHNNATLILHGVTVIGKIKSERGLLEIYDSDLFGHDDMQTTSDKVQNEVVDIHGSSSILVLERCRIKGGKKQGIHITGGAEFRIVNNIIYENGTGTSEDAALKIDTASSMDVFAHNTVADNNVGSAGILCNAMNAQSLTLHHNLFWGHNGTGVVHTDNCCHGDAAYGDPGQNSNDLTSRVAGCANGAMRISTVPFLNAPMDDYHLTRTSIALEGSVLTNVTIYRDFDFQLRGSSLVNMGADEF